MTEKIFILVGDTERLCALYHKPVRSASDLQSLKEEKISDDVLPGQETDADKLLSAVKPLRSTLIIMVHGFPGGHKEGQNDLYGDLEYRLGEEGLPSVRFDFRGCGESEGKSEDFTFKTALKDLEIIQKWAESEGYEKYIYIGEGIGAMLALIHAIRMDDPYVARGVILLWPAFDMRHSPFKPLLSELEKDTAETKEVFVLEGHKVGRAFLEEIRDFNPMSTLKNLSVPILVQHGEKDEQIPVVQLEILRRHARRKRRIELTTYENGGHGLRKLNERTTLYYHIKQFVNRYA